MSPAAEADFRIGDPVLFRQKAFQWACGQGHACCLESGGYETSWSFDCLIGAGASRILRPEKERWRQFRKALDESPGWWLGYLGYDLKNETEALFSSNADEAAFPDLYFFAPLHLIILRGDRATISSPEGPGRIFETINAFPAHQGQPAAGSAPPATSIPSRPAGLPTAIPAPPAASSPPPTALPPAAASPLAAAPPLRQRISREAYLRNVEAIRRHIRDGDVYELNFCLEFFVRDYVCDPPELYRKLTELAPAPFSAYLQLEDFHLLCASPERFLRKKGSRVLSQPIKGTIRRSACPEEDEQLKQQLRNSEKEQAENVMIVDLVRNDLARSAVPGSVNVEELFGIHTFPHWHQMISSVTAEIRPGTHPLDLIRRAFPMGSMTGAPKIMAMKLIEQYEQSKRGVFSGAVGYFSPEGDFDLNVVIRSILYNRSRRYLSFPVGSAITYGSDPESEYQECLLKARAIREVLAS